MVSIPKHIVGIYESSREVNAPSKFKYSLCLASKETPTSRLAFMQGQRYWIELTKRNGVHPAGLGDYQVRGFCYWHHHMARVQMTMLFMLDSTLLHQEDIPLLSYADVRILLSQDLPQRDITLEEVLRQMEYRHRSLPSSIRFSLEKTAHSAA